LRLEALVARCSRTGREVARQRSVAVPPAVDQTKLDAALPPALPVGSVVIVSV
jgi:hypothetical protein